MVDCCSDDIVRSHNDDHYYMRLESGNNLETNKHAYLVCSSVQKYVAVYTHVLFWETDVLGTNTYTV